MKQIGFQDVKVGAIAVNEGASIQNVIQNERSLYFTTANGLSIRLSCEGVKGWRLQANRVGYDAFGIIGASQSLAVYMQEEVSDCSKPLNLQQRDDAIVLSCPCGASAVLSLGALFNLQFVSAEGKTLVELTAPEIVNGEIVMKGVLTEEEGVYGGGERLDVVNKRGTKMDLYSCDGWNNSSTSYVVIPVFFTTRGGGMFFNRYEPALADFGATEQNVWSYKIKADEIDCYFYTAGTPADVLKGYTELSGHAYMPTPWMQGMHICRYWPDHWNFNQDLVYQTLQDIPEWEKLYTSVNGEYVSVTKANADELAKAVKFFTKDGDKYTFVYVTDDAGKYYKRGPKGNPGGNSTKTIMENFIKADMKPAAASMEGRGWSAGFCDTDASRENKANLKASFDWLHAHGMYAMVYIGVGDVNPNNIGFKPEYLIHADVTITKPDGTVEVMENTTAIPWILGTGENPDVGRYENKLRTTTYLDITNDEACEWYFDKIWGEMIEMGIDGVKIDFCEEMPNEGKPYGNVVTHYRWTNPDKIVAGTEHHAYPSFYISAFYKRMLELKEKNGKKDGFMVFSRGGGIGSQRSPYMWAGDQGRTFDKLDDQLMATVNSGLSGIPFMSFDMAGYQYWGEDYHTIGKEKEGEIFARATEFTTFFSQMQTHGDVRHAYEMTEEVQQIYRTYMNLHTELIPYIQKYSKIACETGIPPVRHPVLKYTNDPGVRSLNDEFMLGDALLIAPILEEKTFQKEVYLPAGNTWTNLLTGEVVEGGKTVTVAANLGQVPVFMNNASADVAELAPVFGGINWNAIKNWK